MEPGLPLYSLESVACLLRSYNHLLAPTAAAPTPDVHSIAWRACLLEQENASLRAHVAALRQEALALRSLLAARDEPPAPAPSSTTPD
ncbi:hypothetical protein B5X24_HaOG213470 [Helicoverpa armigera]|uniref:Uncharacterized protein n=1 Tax=Helicoverpa armigera TaxID=29058 RepID=A0A2W1BEZ9_HELAM|nr:hypothetical protein B5X24_HaOG213470 [Helicoverpa armigera]